MSWEDIIKEKFQGAQRENAELAVGYRDLKLTLMNINHTVNQLSKYLEPYLDDENMDWRVKHNLDKIKEDIDEIDKKILEQEKYLGKVTYKNNKDKGVPQKFGDRADSDDKHLGIKFGKRTLGEL
tara:strand:- start:106 stop:480 length:375 start_codon:yes stop_codon:yes gene_type:complete